MHFVKSFSLIALISAGLTFAGEPVHVVCIENVTQDMLNNGESLIIEVPAGCLIPLNLELNGNLLSLNLPNEPRPSLYCKQTFFVHLNKGELLFSLDMLNWKTPLEFITGTLSCTLSAQDESANVSLGAIVNTRS